MTVRIHYHRPGKGTTVFVEHLVLDRTHVKVTLLPSFAGDDVRIGGDVILARHAPVVWYVFPALWRDVGRFHLEDGTFTGWYTNLRYPMKIDGADWSCTDLFLDHWQPADGPGTWLDEEEFLEGYAKGLIDDDTRARVLEERADIEAALGDGSWPPSVTREIDLATARAVLAG